MIPSLPVNSESQEDEEVEECKAKRHASKSFVSWAVLVPLLTDHLTGSTTEMDPAQEAVTLSPSCTGDQTL